MHVVGNGVLSCPDSIVPIGAVTASSGVNFGVYGTTPSPQGYGVYSVGDFGGTRAKYFVRPPPTEPSRKVRFVSLEGNASRTYFRGSSRLQHGRALIELAEAFRLASEAEGLTAQLLAKGPDAGLWVESEGFDQIVIRAKYDVENNYFVNGV